MRRVLAALAIALLLLLAGTGCGTHNKDPRDGHVVIDEEGCIVGGCYTIWKVCMGPDLLYHDSAAEKAHEERLVKDSPECKAAR